MRANANDNNDDDYVIANSNGEAHVDGAAIPLQYATKANHQPAPTANSALQWDDAYGEYGQPYLTITREVQPGREIFTDYSPWFPYARHDMSRRVHFKNEVETTAALPPANKEHKKGVTIHGSSSSLGLISIGSRKSTREHQGRKVRKLGG